MTNQDLKATATKTEIDDMDKRSCRVDILIHKMGIYSILKIKTLKYTVTEIKTPMFVFNRLIADKSTFSELEEILQKNMHTKKERNEINSGNSTKEVKKTV
jgi:hypothetical protein